MTKPFQLEFSGALYHVASRENRLESIYESGADREHCLSNLDEGYTLTKNRQ